MSGSKLHLFYYRMLFVVLAASIALFAISRSHPAIWGFYHHVYFWLITAYTWYILILLFMYQRKQQKYGEYEGGKIAVIIPTYNEDPELFGRALASVVACSGNKQVFVIDDGTKNLNDAEAIQVLCLHHGATYHRFVVNKGKREALFYAVKNFVTLDFDFFVTIDSDTILDKEALVRVVAPLQKSNGNIGASTGNVLLLNEKQNLLTRMIGAYYWTGLEIFKRSQSLLGLVVCCSGCLAGYRTEVIHDIIDEFAGQRFLGEKCTHSEDRHLTNLTLRNNFEVVYVPEALSYTRSPATLPSFMRQQQRWKRGYIREATFTLTYAWKRSKRLYFQTLTVELALPFLFFGLILYVASMTYSDPSFFLHSVLPYWIGFTLIRYSPLIFEAPQKIVGLLVYVFLHELLLYWQFIWALFTVKNKKWLTRG